MAKDSVSVSLGIQGMNRSLHSHLVDEKSYTFARNANLETDLEGIALTNEHSNLLCSKLGISDKEQVIVGYKYDGLGSRLILFLTDRYVTKNENYDPEKCSSKKYVRTSQIGYIPVSSDISDESDLEINCGCDIKSILSTPLEELKGNFSEHCKYVPIISDCEEAGYCLNFDPNYPIKDIVIKKEACGTMMVFASENNPPRHINLDNINEYRVNKRFKCGDEEENVCIDCNKLLLFPEYSPIHIIPSEIVYGGNLNRGLYDFYVAYCDEKGNELTEYTSATNSISIFDKKNIRLDETTLFSKTTSGIRLQVDNIDNKFEYYKVVVVERVSKDVKGISSFVVGVYPVNVTDVYYTANSTEQMRNRIDFNNITIEKPIYKSFKGITSSGGHLFGYGYEVEKEWNLQPVVSLLGTFLKWQTSEAGENLYLDGVNNAKYKAYMRDEVYPFGIRFRTNTGYKTAVFPFIGRPAYNYEIENVNLNSFDVKSVLDITAECDENTRDKYWQYYNTAKEIDFSTDTDSRKNIKIVSKTNVEECIVDNAIELLNGRIEMNISDEYVDLKDWVNNYGSLIKEEEDTDSIYYSKELRDILRTNVEGSCNYEDLFDALICDSFDDCGGKYCDKDSKYYNEELCREVLNNCQSGGCLGTCTDVTRTDKEGVIRLEDIVGERLTKVEKLFPWEEGDAPRYVHGKSDDNLNQFAVDEADKRDDFVEYSFEGTIKGIRSVLLPNPSNPLVDTPVIRPEDAEISFNFPIKSVHNRLNTPENYDCNTSKSLDAVGQYFVPKFVGEIIVSSEKVHSVKDFWKGTSGKYYINDLGEVLPEDEFKGDIDSLVLTKIPSKPVSGKFNDKVHVGALWYSVSLTDQEDKLLEITPMNKGQQGDSMTDDSLVRITIIDKCSPSNYLFSDTYSPKKGYWKLLKKSELGNKNNLIIILDTPIKEVSGKQRVPEEGNTFNVYNNTVNYTLKGNSALSGTFNVLVRPREYYKQLLEYDKLVFSYAQEYSAKCYYPAPKISDCGVTPHKYGIFSYWESNVTYPPNKDLYDSSGLKINLERLKAIEDRELVELFAKEYLGKDDIVDIEKGYAYSINDNGDFRCKPIRHFKFPDNKVSPFMNTYNNSGFQESVIYPLGVTINNDTVKLFLDFAVETGLIDKCQRDSIVGYDILRGDRVVKSVLTRGILNDMYKDTVYSDPDKPVYFRNFPYNTLGSNIYLTTDGKKSLEHPHSSVKNNRFSFISPEVYLDSTNIPATEMTVDGYVKGDSETQWVYVKNHSEWVILGSRAKKEASRFAWLEASFELALTLATFYVEASKNGWFIVGQPSGGNKIGSAKAWLAIGTFAGTQAANSLLFKRPKYETQWLQIIEDKGPLANHAQYSVSHKGYYNTFVPVSKKDNYLRGINKLIYLTNTRVNTVERKGNDTSEKVMINNLDRENSFYISTGNYFVEYDNKYVGIDNYSKYPRRSSRVTVGDIGKCNQATPIHFGKIASLYVSLKRYVPDQYGTVDSIKWLTTGNDPYFSKKSMVIFGGDIYITRVDFKNKFRFFTADAVGLQHRTPIKYTDHENIAKPRYYANYKTQVGLEASMLNAYFADTDRCLDCDKGKSYYEPSSKRFYLFSYGVPYFLVESTINGEYRYAGAEPHEQFSSMGIDMIDFTQEDNVPIHTHETFKYNDVYSWSNMGLPSKILPSTYDKERWDCLAKVDNGVAWSDMDSNEESLSNPWLIFRGLNNYRFPTSFGKLISLNNIESNVVLGRFTDNMTMFNAVDVLKDRIDSSNAPIGNGGIFASGRPVQFSNTELGETGTQHTDFITTEFGHFWVDAKRGKVFHIGSGGKDLIAISDFKSGEGDSGMRRWFKRHLPFKILKQGIENLTDTDLDNKYKGLGISMGWDSRFKRLFITKLDYVVRNRFKGKIKYSGGNFYIDEEGELVEIDLQNSKYFKNVSWTIAYSPIYKSWTSYYDFKPDIYIAYNDYFQTVVNYPEKGKDYRKGIWSHLLTNKSYQVFYGDYYPFEIEYVIKNTHTNNLLKDIKVWSFSHRYHDNYDYSQWKNKSFNKVIIYNQTNNSGLLNLDYTNSLKRHEYPKTLSPVEQLIQGTHHEEYISFNYFFNRVRDEDSGVPIWNNDENEIVKELSSDNISFNSKKVLERLRGDWFNVRLIQDSTSQFKQVFKWGVDRKNSY